MNTEQRAQDAAYILEHPLFKEAFKRVEAGLVQNIKDANLMDEQIVSKLMLSLQILEAIKSNIEGHIADAVYDASPIEEM